MILPSCRSDIAIAVRLMRKQPILTLTAILALATGIGMATVGFSLLEAVLYSRLPFSGGERFVLVDVRTEPEARRADLEDERFRALRENARALRHLGAARSSATNLLTLSGEVALLSSTFITPDSFGVLPFAPMIGRTLNGDDARPGATAVVLLRESAWRRHFSGNPSVVGTVANFGGVRRTIVGVMPDVFEFPHSAEVWLPIDTAAGARIFGVLARDGSEQVATAQLMSLSRQFESASPGVPRLRLDALPFTKGLSRGLDLMAAALVAVLLLVLLVIGANVANLVLARTLSRSTELAIRTAIGATRSRLVGQIFIEVLVLGSIAAIVGLAASQLVLRWAMMTLSGLPFWVTFETGPRTMAFVVAVTLGSAAVASIAPALRATRRNTAAVLSTASRSVSPGFGRLGSAMIALQVTLSIALLNGALVVARGVSGYMDGALDLPTGQVLTARVVMSEAAPSGPRHAEIVAALRDLPGVAGAGLATSLPRLSPPAVMTTVRSETSAVPSAARATPVVAASVGFFEALGVRASAGRLFQSVDFQVRSRPVAIVNEPFVTKFFNGANPVGRQLRIVDADASSDDQPWREIVGVVPDLGLSAGDESLAAGYYLPMNEETSFHLILQAPAGLAVMDSLLRTTLARADPRILVREVIPLEAVGSEDRAVFAGIGAALTALGGIALLLSVIGVYAMLSLSVTQRTREIAIRSALGATRLQVLRPVTGRASVPLAIGALAGYALGSVLVAARGIFAFRLPADSGPWGMPALCALILAAGLGASWVPARRALRVATSDALRSD